MENTMVRQPDPQSRKPAEPPVDKSALDGCVKVLDGKVEAVRIDIKTLNEELNAKMDGIRTEARADSKALGQRLDEVQAEIRQIGEQITYSEVRFYKRAFWTLVGFVFAIIGAGRYLF